MKRKNRRDMTSNILRMNFSLIIALNFRFVSISRQKRESERTRYWEISLHLPHLFALAWKSHGIHFHLENRKRKSKVWVDVYLAQIIEIPFISYAFGWCRFIGLHEIPNAVQTFHFPRFGLPGIEQPLRSCIFCTEHHKTEYKTQNVSTTSHDSVSAICLYQRTAKRVEK